MDLCRFSFGVTAAITTSLALIVGLGAAHSTKILLISTLLVLAIADNMTDSLSIHIYQESGPQYKDQDSNARPKHKTIITTLSNFLTRFAVTIVFLLLVLSLPLQYAMISSVIIGLAVLSILSYKIAINQKTSPYRAIFEHVGIAVVVIPISYFIGQMIAAMGA